MPTAFLPLRAASKAASLTRFARSAPTKPRVIAATCLTFTSSSTLTFCTWTLRISSRPPTSGRSTSTWRSNRPGRSSAGSSVSGRLVAAMMMTPLLVSKPSISTSNALSVCSRSSCPPIWPLPRVLPRASSSSMKMMHGRLGFGLLEHVADARRPDADEHFDEVRAAEAEERHARLAGDGLGQQRLAGARRADQQHALRDAAAQAVILARGSSGSRPPRAASSTASSMPATSSNVTSISSCAYQLAAAAAERHRRAGAAHAAEHHDHQHHKHASEHQHRQVSQELARRHLVLPVLDAVLSQQVGQPIFVGRAIDAEVDALAFRRLGAQRAALHFVAGQLRAPSPYRSLPSGRW